MSSVKRRLQTGSDLQDVKPKLSLRVRIAISVTDGSDPPDVEATVDRILQSVERMTPPSTPLLLTIITALGSATERALAAAAMKLPCTSLEVPIHGSRDEYPSVFSSDAERQEVIELLAKANRVVVLAENRERHSRLLGRYLTDHCDILIVGSRDDLLTSNSELDRYAVERARERQVVLMHLENGAQIEKGTGRLSEPLLHTIDTYNRSITTPELVAEATARRIETLLEQSERAGLNHAYVRSLFDWTAPYFVRADTLANRFQRSYFRLGTAVLLMAAAAVLVAASQILFDFAYSRMALIEVFLMLILLVLLIYGKRRRVHERWMAMRALAERLRTIAFLGIAGVDIEDFISSRSKGGSQPWSSRVIEDLLHSSPRIDATQVPINHLKEFLATAWLRDQLDYHQETADKFERRDRVLGLAVAGLFAATLVSALLHGLDVAHESSDWLIFASISLPAIAGALDGIRSQREYVRSAERSGRLGLRLRDLWIRMQEAATPSDIQEVAKAAGDVILEENQDWHAAMRFHDLELRV